MKRRTALSLLLSLTLLLTSALPAITAYAEENSGSGMEISKTATANSDGSYTITLEAYATGSKVISQETKDVPTDIILVLDQSGSMDKDIGTVTYSQYRQNTTNSTNYSNRHNGGNANLWYKLSDGSYVSASVTKTTQYTELSKSLVNCSTDWFGDLTTSCYYYYANNLYEKVGDEYKKVTLTQTTSGNWSRTYTYTYTFPDGTTVESKGRDTIPDLGSHAPLYTPAADGNSTVYTYTYTDKDGNVQTIGTSTGASTRYTPAFYQRTTNSSGGGSRLDALKTAVTSFANAVNAKAKGKDGTYGTSDDINHRIAVVGFASGDYYNYSNYNYGNTEVFVGSNQYTYGDAAKGQYANAFQDMNTAAGVSNISASIGALAANGGTLTNLGLEMANGIFEKNPIQPNEKRNRVVVVFTDGVPGWSGYESATANSAITQATTAKNTYGATVYTIGIFSGADATSPGNQNGNNDTQKANWFMQQVSSNNGTPRSPSYYLSAGDSASLNNIFQQISSQIETGGSSTTLSESTVIKDIISPQFTLPEGATVGDITLETYKYKGPTPTSTGAWEPNNDSLGATASITSTDASHETTTQNQVSVTGFDFAENYVGTVTENGTTTYRGNKLVISFKVMPRPGFLGGNAVITNTSAGVYPDENATDPVLRFDQPKVDVTIKEPQITLPDANVYLGAYFHDTVNAEDLKNGTAIKFGDNIALDLTKPNDNWGLESWQTEYVTIEVKVTDKDGNEVTDFEKLMDDTEYQVSVSIKPKTPKADNNGYEESMTGTIHVFKPELTFKDSTAYYGESVPANKDYSGNYVTGSEKWKNGDKDSTDDDVEMLGTKPTLDISYSPDETKLDNGKYTKQDVPVSATIKIGGDDVTGYTAFLHENCTVENCGWASPEDPGAPAFLIHIKTCTLSITKQGGAANESYVFDVYKDSVKYSEVTVWGNGTETLVELPIGTYTIQENTGWSWRYSADNGSSAALTAQTPTGSITCTNTAKSNQWLNGFSEVVRNIFGTNH